METPVPYISVAREAYELGMRAALDEARLALAAGEPPIGACLLQDGAIVARAYSGVIAGPDPTAHAEIAVIREASRKLRSADLGGCILCVTVEPCQMCLGACHYAGIGQVFCGASIADLHRHTRSECPATAAGSVRVVTGVLATECRSLLKEWGARRR